MSDFNVEIPDAHDTPRGIALTLGSLCALVSAIVWLVVR